MGLFKWNNMEIGKGLAVVIIIQILAVIVITVWGFFV
jgi:hypothetical protein